MKIFLCYLLCATFISITPLHAREFETLLDENGKAFDFVTNKSPIIRINFGISCTATWLSPDGLMLTNIHCIESCLYMYAEKEDIPGTVMDSNGNKPYYIYRLKVNSLSDIQCEFNNVMGLEAQILSLGAHAWIPPEFKASLRENYREIHDKLLQEGVNGINGLGDFALLKIVRTSPVQPINLSRGIYFSYPPSCLKLSQTPIAPEQEVRGLSYPDIERPKFKIERQIYSPMVSKGIFIKRDKHPIFSFQEIEDYFGSDKETIFSSVDAESGSSGSPLLDNNGDVLALVYATLAPRDAYLEGGTIAIPMETILRKFNKDLGEDFVFNLLNNSCTHSDDTDKLLKLLLKI